jgi:hypothetical protein
MSLASFENAIPATKRPNTYTLDLVATNRYYVWFNKRRYQ